MSIVWLLIACVCFLVASVLIYEELAALRARRLARRTTFEDVSLHRALLAENRLAEWASREEVDRT